MKRQNRTVAVVGAWLLASAACLLTAQVAPAAAQPPARPVFGPSVPSPASPSSGPIGPRSGVLLLKNGEALSGRIAQVGDYYEVLLPNGRIRLRAAEVEMTCADLEEGYQRKRAAIRLDDARAHLRLAWWCMHHDLLGHAAAELADATRLDPDDPLIAPVKRRLELALNPPDVSSTPGAAGETAEAAQAPKSGPSLEELDRIVRELPPGTVGEFRQVIQPMLWNSCASGQCHGAQGSETFRLLRAPHGHVATRRLTQRNLHSVLSQINRTDPAQSPLLRAARTAHGPADQRVIAPADATQYRTLAAWVAGITAAETQVHEAAADPSALPAAEGPQAAVFTAPDVLAEPRQAGGAPEQTDRQQSNVQYGARLEVFEPVDPFDPEIFNRRYFPRSTEAPDTADSPDAAGPRHLPRASPARPHLVPSNPTPLQPARPTSVSPAEEAPPPRQHSQGVQAPGHEVQYAQPRAHEPQSARAGASGAQEPLVPDAQSSWISPR